MPDVSVIIVNWNTASLLSNCLRSLEKGLRNSSYEVFVVDNGSTDGSQQMVREVFPQVTLIENGRNLGFARANNVALRQASGDFFLLLNSDAVLCEDSIDTVVAFMRDTPDAGFASPQLINEDDSLQNTAANFPDLVTELGQKSLLRILFPEKYYKKRMVAEKPVAVQTLVGACLLARREMTDRIGFYDEDFFFFLEETEWCLRAHKAGYKCYLVPQARVYHLQGQTAKKVPIAVRTEYWCSRYTYFRKHYGFAANLFLKGGLLTKLLVNTILNGLIAPLSAKGRHKFVLGLHLFKWHFCGCPAEMGLSAGQD